MNNQLTVRVLILFVLCVFGFGSGCASPADSPIQSRGVATTTIPVVSRSGSLGLGIDRSIKTPLTARGRCLDLLINCHSITDKTRDHCVNQMRRCETSQPWKETESCCPSTCIDTYLRERRKGINYKQATITAFEQRDCYPGVQEMIKGKPWQ
ncbi:hypothetical protein KBD61_05755 [Patescibacteria group bacterium]|nr:hypothetical protein [Patescibacteria group bacterium]MBP9710493.1 hypothetical protein [Patescibacteria group bacterium]